VKQAIIDFESEAIRQRPEYPPLPVGLAVSLPGEPMEYDSWGHASENGIYVLKGKKLHKIEGDPKRRAALKLKEAKKCDSVLGHNSSKFDWDVAETHMGVAPPPWHKQDDSLFSRFLVDPHAKSLSLKPAAEEVLGELPEERDAVYEWLHEHGFIQKKMEHGRPKYQKDAGAYISKAPGFLVALYAIGDLTRSKSLWDHDMKVIKRDGMLDAYRVEQQVAPILLKNEREGMRVDIELLEKDQKIYRNALAKVELWLLKRLKAPASINWDSDAEVADALRKSRVVKEFPKTATGKDSVSSRRLTRSFFSDVDVHRALIYRNIVAYVLSQNIEPWLETATKSGGRVFTIWNQVRSPEDKGARSGRITCAKWANIIKDPTGGKNPEYKVEDDAAIRKKIGLPPLPLARKYCLPDVGDLLVHRDWNQQELRLLAHYEEGSLAEAYRSDPKVDIHQYVTDLIKRVTQNNYERNVIKHVNFRTVYGGGVEGLVEHPMLRFDAVYKCRHGGLHGRAKCPAYKAAAEVLGSWRKALPDVVLLTKRLSSMYQRDEPVRTLGGRLYRCKAPTLAAVKDSDGAKHFEQRTYEYTALNYLLQPSGADLLKKALINYDQHPKRRGRLINTVYDEMNSSAPKKLAKQENLVLKEVMEAIKLDVPWKSDGDERPNWGEKAKT
jgi:DNA polymerase I-like protein with 3'-5' exonuclease and polymerase domains